VTAYRMDAVAPTCLALQDDLGVDVNLLLYAAWLAHREQRLSQAHLRELDGRVAAWRATAVRPLRMLRRRLKGISRAAGLQRGIAALELRAERRQQDLMYRYYRSAASLPRAAGALSGNLALVARHCSRRESGWEGSISRLHRLLEP